MNEQEVLDAPQQATIKVYRPIEAGISLMLEKHGHVLTHPPVVTNDDKALALVKTSRQELVKFRTTLEKARKEEKAESLAYGRLVDSEAARIQAFATPLELAYDKIVTDEEGRLETIRQAELERERQRIAGHRARIQSIKEVRETANMCRSSDRLKQLIDGMPAHLEQPFEEFQGEAETAFNEVCTVLGQLHGVKVEAEAQAAELARQQAELAAQRAEAERLQSERDVEEERQRAQRQKDADDLAARRAEFENEQAKARADQQAEADRLADQQREIDEQKRQQEAEHAAAAPAVPVLAPVTDQRPMSDREWAALPAGDRELPHHMVYSDSTLRFSDCKSDPDYGVVAIEPAATPAMTNTPPTLRLGQITERLGFALPADFLRTLGFEPAGRDRAAVLYHEQDFDPICIALNRHINNVRAKQAAHQGVAA